MAKTLRKKIAVLYAGHGGHCQAAFNIKEAVEELAKREEIKGIEVHAIDFFKYLHSWGLGFVLEWAYLQMIRRDPGKWGKLYDNPDIYAKGIKKLNKWVSLKALNKHFKLPKLVGELKPDIFCFTQAYPGLVLALLKERKQNFFIAPIVGVSTDWYPHRWGINPSIDYYIVPSEQAAKDLAAKETIGNYFVKDHRIGVLGIPISSKFSGVINKREIVNKLQLNEFLPIILVAGGTWGMGPISEAVEELKAIEKVKKFPLFQVVVICGNDQELKERLEKKFFPPSNKFFSLREPVKFLKILGKVENEDVCKLMKISSLIITKPGGITTSECLACGLPIIVVNPIPGQEERNRIFLEGNGAAVSAGSGKEAAIIAVGLLMNPKDMEAMSRNARKIAKPNAVSGIAELLVKNQIISNGVLTENII